MEVATIIDHPLSPLETLLWLLIPSAGAISAGLGHIVAAQAILEILGSTMAVAAFLSSRLCPWPGSRSNCIDNVYRNIYQLSSCISY